MGSISLQRQVQLPMCGKLRLAWKCPIAARASRPSMIRTKVLTYQYAFKCWGLKAQWKRCGAELSSYHASGTAVAIDALRPGRRAIECAGKA